MKKRAWMVVGMFAVAAIFGGSFYGAEDAKASKMTADVKQADKMKIHRSNETKEKIEKAWNSAKETFAFDDRGWTQYDYADRSHFTATMSEQEKSSFYEAMLSAMSEHQKVGDMMPILLVNNDKTKAVILFKRDEGKGASVKIELTLAEGSTSSTSAKSDKASKVWKVDSVEEK